MESMSSNLVGADACESPSQIIREGNAIRLWILVSRSAVCPQQGWAGDVAAQEQVCFVCPGLSNKHVGMCFGALVTCHSAWMIFKCKLTSLLCPVDGGAGSSFPLLSVTYRRAKADKLHFCPEQTLDMGCPLWKPSIWMTEKLQLLPPADPARLADSTKTGFADIKVPGIASTLPPLLWCWQHAFLGLRV